MSESLRDQLLKAGFKPSPKAQAEQYPRRPEPRHPASQKRQEHQRQRETGEPNLARAFAMRAKLERSEREAAEREAREKAAARKERKRKLQELLDGKAINCDDAERVRNFEFAGKIRRIHVTSEQWRMLNAGELGVVMHTGRAMLVTREAALAAQAVAPEVVALLVDPGARAADDGVPDDLVW